MKKILLAAVTPLVLWSAVSSASPLLQQWQGTGAEANKRFCKYGDGEVKVVSASQNCPSSN